jgi:hypothetical protein
MAKHQYLLTIKIVLDSKVTKKAVKAWLLSYLPRAPNVIGYHALVRDVKITRVDME